MPVDPAPIPGAGSDGFSVGVELRAVVLVRIGVLVSPKAADVGLVVEQCALARQCGGGPAHGFGDGVVPQAAHLALAVAELRHLHAPGALPAVRQDLPDAGVGDVGNPDIFGFRHAVDGEIECSARGPHELQAAGRGVDEHGEGFGFLGGKTGDRHPPVADEFFIAGGGGDTRRVRSLPRRHQQISRFLQELFRSAARVFVPPLRSPMRVRRTPYRGLAVGACGFQNRETFRRARGRRLEGGAQQPARLLRRQTGRLDGAHFRMVGVSKGRFGEFGGTPDGRRPVSGLDPLRRPQGRFAPPVGERPGLAAGQGVVQGGSLGLVDGHTVQIDDAGGRSGAVVPSGDDDALATVGTLTQVDVPGSVTGENHMDAVAPREDAPFVQRGRCGKSDGWNDHRQDAVLVVYTFIRQRDEQRLHVVFINKVRHGPVVAHQHSLHAVRAGAQRLLRGLGELLAHFAPACEGRIHDDDAGVFHRVRGVFQFGVVGLIPHGPGADIVVGQIEFAVSGYDGPLSQEFQRPG